MNNIVGGAFVDYTFIHETEIIDKLLKMIKSWNTLDFEVARNTYLVGISLEQHKREEEHDKTWLL